jgi:lysophospholipase L1-like esterase
MRDTVAIRLASIASLACLAALACSKDASIAPVDGGSGGASGDDGGAGSGGGSPDALTIDGIVVPPPACDPAASTLGAVTDATPLVSMGKPVKASAGVTAPEKVVDGIYHGTPAVLPAPTAQAPAWIAINVGAGPARLLLAWSDPGYGAYNDITGANGASSPVAYTIDTSADTTNGADGTWTTVVTVTDNPVRNRAHSFDFGGKSWVRFSVTAPAPNIANVGLDEIALHDITQAGQGRPSDTWFFMGDSITAGAFKRNLRDTFDTIVHTAHPGQYPVMLNGGIGGELSSMGAGHIDDWLKLNPDFTHFAILYGTNDSWDNDGSAAGSMQSNLDMIVQKLLADGRVPILARIPYASMHHATLAPFNAAIDQLSTNRGLPCGPDFYAWFISHPDQLGPDGVHPADAGNVSMNRLWAAMADRFYPQ